MNHYYQKHNRQMSIYPYENLIFHKHLHKEVEFIFLQKGELQVNLENLHQTLHAGDAAIIFPNHMHSYTTPKYNKGILIVFTVQMAGDFESMLTGYTCEIPFIDKENLSPDALMCINSIISKDFTKKDALLRGYTSVLLGNLFDIVKPLKKNISQSQYSMNSLFQYVMDHYLEPLTLDQIAADTDMSKYTISRIFNQELQSSFKDYLNTMRLGYAQHLLCDLNLTITEIAFESGFSSLRTFNRVFYENLGMSPSEYRKTLY